MRRLLAALLALACFPAFATGPSVLHHELDIQGAAAASGSFTLTNQPTVGNLLVVLVDQTGNSSSETISTTPSNTCSKQASAFTSSENVASIWTCPVASSAAGFTVNYSGFATVAAGAIETVEVTGQNSSAPVDGTPQATNYANALSTAVSQPVGTASQANDLGILVVVANSGEGWTWTAPLTELDHSNSVSSVIGAAAGTITSSGATTLAATMSVSTKKSSAGILIAPTGGGSSCTHQGITLGGALAVPDGSTGSYRLKNGSFGTPDCSTVIYFQPTLGNFGVN